MDHLPEEKTISFIVKIWLEETLPESGATTWRGHVTHVPSGERRYFQELDEAQRFMSHILTELTGQTDPAARPWFSRWWRRWREVR